MRKICTWCAFALIVLIGADGLAAESGWGKKCEFLLEETHFSFSLPFSDGFKALKYSDLANIESSSNDAENSASISIFIEEADFTHKYSIEDWCVENKEEFQGRAAAINALTGFKEILNGYECTLSKYYHELQKDWFIIKSGVYIQGYLISLEVNVSRGSEAEELARSYAENIINSLLINGQKI